MKETADQISDFHKLQKEFGFLESIKLHREIGAEGCTEYSAEIIMCDYPSYSVGNKLLLLFHGMKDIFFGDIEGLLKLQITVIDVEGDQWEKIRFKVKEVEHEQFSFYCDDFSFRVI